MMNTQNKSYEMLPSIEMIIEDVDEEIPQVIVTTFDIQFCVCGFHFFSRFLAT